MTDVHTIGLDGIREELHDFAVPVEQITTYPGNARRGDHARIRNSLRKHGQYKVLPVQRATGHVLMGNNTYAVMREMGYTLVAVQYLDVDDVKAREMLLIDNASSDEAIYDDAALAKLLSQVEDWDATGFAPDDLDDVLASLNAQAGDDPGKLAAVLPPEVAAIAPTVLPTVPVTDARYSETPDEERERQQRYEQGVTRAAQGVTEIILVYPEPVRNAVLSLIAQCRGRLGVDRNGDVVHGALRLLAEIVEAEKRGSASVDVALCLSVAVPPPPDPPAVTGGGPAPGETEPDGDPEGPDGGR